MLHGHSFHSVASSQKNSKTVVKQNLLNIQRNNWLRPSSSIGLKNKQPRPNLMSLAESVAVSIWGVFPRSIISQVWSQVSSIVTNIVQRLEFPETTVQANIHKQHLKLTWLELQLSTCGQKHSQLLVRHMDLNN